MEKKGTYQDNIVYGYASHDDQQEPCICQMKSFDHQISRNQASAEIHGKYQKSHQYIFTGQAGGGEGISGRDTDSQTEKGTACRIQNGVHIALPDTHVPENLGITDCSKALGIQQHLTRIDINGIRKGSDYHKENGIGY